MGDQNGTPARDRPLIPNVNLAKSTSTIEGTAAGRVAVNKGAYVGAILEPTGQIRAMSLFIDPQTDQASAIIASFAGAIDAKAVESSLSDGYKRVAAGTNKSATAQVTVGDLVYRVARAGTDPVNDPVVIITVLRSRDADLRDGVQTSIAAATVS